MNQVVSFQGCFLNLAIAIIEFGKQPWKHIVCYIELECKDGYHALRRNTLE